jgi:hypothetical protein
MAELCCGVMQRLDLAGRCSWGPSSLPPPKVTFATTFHNPRNRRLDFTNTFDSMSRASKITLATTCFGAVGIIAAVHFGQKIEKAVRLHSNHRSESLYLTSHRQCTPVSSATTSNNG